MFTIKDKMLNLIELRTRGLEGDKAKELLICSVCTRSWGEKKEKSGEDVDKESLSTRMYLA